MKTQHILAPKEILSTRLFEGENDVLCKEMETPTNNRKSAWIEFFNENQTNPFCFHSESFLAVLMFFEGDNLIKEQTGFEFEMSKAFYCELFSLKRQMVLSDTVAAQKLLMLSLIFGKYPGIFRESISNYFRSCDMLLNDEIIDSFFTKSLVKYETPHYFIRNFQHLNREEVEILIYTLSKGSLRKYSLFQVQPTKKEFSQLLQLNALYITENDHLFTRGLIYVKLVGSKYQLDEIETNGSALTAIFLNASRTFLTNPKKYLIDIEFWRKAYLLIVRKRINLINFRITDCVDYLEYMKYQSGTDYSLKGRTTESLIRATRQWHQQIYNEKLTATLNLKWEKSEELELYFSIGKRNFSCVQLNSSLDLFKEGKIMKNCVITYAQSCANLYCTIWSLRLNKKEDFYPFMTIEVINRTIVQARTKANGTPNEKQLDILHNWAMRMEYKIDLFKND